MRHAIRALRTFILHGVFDSLNKSSKHSENRKVYLPKLILIIGIIVSAVLLIPALAIFLVDGAILEAIGFFAFSLLGDVLIVAYLNCRISYDEEGFLYKSFFGIKRRFTYDQVTALRTNSYERYLYVGKKRLMIDNFAVGGDEFISFVKKKYRTLHDGQALPKIKKAKHDIFNGNVKDAGGFIFVYIFVSLVFLILLSIIVYIVYFNTASASNTDKHTVTFVSYQKNSKDIIFKSDDDRIYKIKNWDRLMYQEDADLLCDGRTKTVYSTLISPDEQEPYNSIKAIEYKGEFILSFDETNRAYREENQAAVIIVAVICLVWCVVVAVSINVGRHPHKYSKWFVRLFFKDGYI